MVTPATALLPPPKSWDEFEEMCADLFGKVWGDPNTIRYGRQGQRQNGVDIYGQPRQGQFAGVQCKGKRRWPPLPLKTADIDREVRAARKFSPPLSEFIVATTAPDDGQIQDHVRALTERHQKNGLFTVHVFGWDELLRRLTQYSDLLEKHYSYYAAPLPRHELNLVAAVERDLAKRYEAAVRRSLFPEAANADGVQLLAMEIDQTYYSEVSPELRRRIFLRAARSTALRGNLEDADYFLAKADAIAGPDSDLPAKARIAEARGDTDRAIALLRDRADPDCFCTLFTVVARHRGADAAVEWLAQEGWTVESLTANGLHALAVAHLQRNDPEGARNVLRAATALQLDEAPYLIFLRAILSFTCLLSEADRGVPLSGHLLDVRRARPVVDEAVAIAELDSAISDLTRLIPIASDLGLNEGHRTAEAYLRWCRLLHPHQHSAELQRLRADMEEPKTALSNVHFALAFDQAFEPEAVLRYLEKREKIVGLGGEELLAALVLRIHGDEPEAIADLIETHRVSLDERLGPVTVALLEIQALAKCKRSGDARRVLTQIEGEVDRATMSLLEIEIAKGEGADPVQEHMRAYEETRSPEALMGLVAALSDTKDFDATGHYAEKLHQQTHDRQALFLAAQAYARGGKKENFVRVVEEHRFLLQQNSSLSREYAWTLFRYGRIDEAGQEADRLRLAFVDARDINLEVAIAIESGDWEALAQPLEATLSQSDHLDGPTLIRAAHLAHASGQGPMSALLRAAIEKGGDDADVLLGAYLLTVERGLEEEHPQAGDWFRRAVDLSGENGPVKKFELRELLPQQIEWNEHSRMVTQGIVRGDFPLSIAASGLRTTVVDIVLRNLIRNSSISDRRRCVPIPLYSGRRSAVPFGSVQRLGLDVVALMVLSWLNILPQVLAAVPEFVIPAGLMHELFEGRRRIQSFQRSRLQRAQAIRGAIATEKLKVVRSTKASHDPLSDELGEDLAGLIRAAEASDGLVLRPAPVHRPGIEMEIADISSHADRITDMHSLLAMLVDAGALDQTTEDTARGYFQVQDRGWPNPPLPTADKPLFIDDLALAYLQSTNLLSIVLDTLKEVHIGLGAEEDASNLIEYDRHIAQALQLIDNIRLSISHARSQGKVTFGSRKLLMDEERAPYPATLNLISALSGVDAILVDDRALNSEPFVQDQNAHRARTLTSLDAIEELYKRGTLSEAERRSLRHRLRRAGAMLMPVDLEELVQAAIRTRKGESAELRAIRESLDMAAISGIPRFPSEIAWLASLTQGTRVAAVDVWNREEDVERARELAEMLLQLCPKPEDWLHNWDGEVPPGWVDAVANITVAGLAMPVELHEQQRLSAYKDWLENRILAEIRLVTPDRYAAVVRILRDLVLGTDDA